MGEIPQVNHTRVIKALEKAGYRISRQGKHVFMTDGKSVVVVPRNNPIKAGTLKQIIESANLTLQEFKELL
ncbi:MAG: type II toxin-antitoxin system HicA family toxin [Nitrospirae bacterium]|nr:type II toxin-antitoxin system HicA family toxin [Nitrospirota bacterium]